MESFTTLTGIAAPLLVPDINTDVIIRIERLVSLPRGELGPFGFEAWRYRSDGTEEPNFVLNQPPFRHASIMLGGPNFACGSSREAAVWAMWDMGYRCVIAPSFGEIFYTNCFQNGLLALELPIGLVEELAEMSLGDSTAAMTVDLSQQTISCAKGREFSFTIDAARRDALLQGLDEISVTLRHEGEIALYQQMAREQTPWLLSPKHVGRASQGDQL